MSLVLDLTHGRQKATNPQRPRRSSEIDLHETECDIYSYNPDDLAADPLFGSALANASSTACSVKISSTGCNHEPS
jgi:hypothetical protein